MRFTLVSLLAVLALPVAALAQGALTPPGAPSPTMKSLDQVEARTPIGKVGGSTVTITITEHGSYVLMGNITVESGNGIVIASDCVTLDLNGFTILSNARPADGTGISVNYGLRNITVRNGHIRGNTNWYGTGFEGLGFTAGFVAQSAQCGMVENVTTYGVYGDGITFNGANSTTTIRNCTVSVCASIGLKAGLVTDSSADGCGYFGITADSVTNCYGKSVSSGVGIQATTANNCHGESNSNTGVAADNATNCYGLSNTGEGLSSRCSATSCTGISTTQTGLSASTATNCTGRTTSGYAGLSANIASYCTGSNSDSGAAIAAPIGIGCIIFSGTARINNRYLMP